MTNVDGKILGLSNLDSFMTYIRGFAVLHPFMSVLSIHRGTRLLASWDMFCCKSRNCASSLLNFIK
jgi:hypothetical protein